MCKRSTLAVLVLCISGSVSLFSSEPLLLFNQDTQSLYATVESRRDRGAEYIATWDAHNTALQPLESEVQQKIEVLANEDKTLFSELAKENPPLISLRRGTYIPEKALQGTIEQLEAVPAQQKERYKKAQIYIPRVQAKKKQAQELQEVLQKLLSSSCAIVQELASLWESIKESQVKQDLKKKDRHPEALAARLGSVHDDANTVLAPFGEELGRAPCRLLEEMARGKAPQLQPIAQKPLTAEEKKEELQRKRDAMEEQLRKDRLANLDRAAQAVKEADQEEQRKREEKIQQIMKKDPKKSRQQAEEEADEDWD